MRTLYFPYTFLAQETLEALSACFDRITLYQPTVRHTPASIRDWAKAGRLELRVPARAFEPQIEEHLQSLQGLGALYGGQQGGTANFPPPGIPFHDENGSAEIRSNLRRMIRGEALPRTETTASPGGVLQACLFLQFAQEFDSHQEALGRDLKACEAIEQALFSGLRGDDEELALEKPSPGPPFPSAATRREHMLAERLSAWACLFLYDLAGGQGKSTAALDAPVVLVTTDRLAFDELLDQAPEEAIEFDLLVERGDGTARELPNVLSRLASGLEEAPPALDPTVQDGIEVHGALIPKLSPGDLLTACAGIQWEGSAKDRTQPNTVICLVSG